MLRTIRRLLVLAAVLVVVLGIADRIALRAAQNEVQKQVVSRATWTGGTTKVAIHGFPFLTQVAFGTYDDIEVLAEGVSLEGIDGIDATVHLRGLHLPLSSLREDAGSRTVPIDTVDGTASVPYSQLEQRARAVGAAEGIKALSLSDGGTKVKVSATVNVPLLGIPVTATALAGLSIDGSKAQLVASSVEVAGVTVPASISSAVLGSINKVLVSSFVIPELPYGLRITSIRPGPTGVIVTASASDVVA